MAKKRKLEIDTKTMKQFERQVSIYQKNVAKGKERKSESFENLISDISKFYKKRGKGIAKTKTKTIAQKVRLNLLLSNFKKSNLVTAKKRKERGQKIRNTLTQKWGKKTADKALSIFSTDAYHYFKDIGFFDSDQVKTMASEYEDIDEEVLQKVFEEAKSRIQNDVPEELRLKLKDDDLYAEIEKLIQEYKQLKGN